MTVSFSAATTYHPTDTCAICLDSLNNGKEVVAHSKGGENHPIHKTCV